MKRFFTLLLFISITTISFCQDQYKLYGYLTDDDGELLPYATVYI